MFSEVTMAKTKYMVLFLLAGEAFAQATYLTPPTSIPARRPTESLCWRSSLAVLAAGNAIDTASSYGYGEANSLLRSSNGRFEARGIALKASLVGAAAAVEYLVLRRTHGVRWTRLFAWFNTDMGTMTGAVGVRNYFIRNRGAAPGAN
jgi:hypothetical protein